jgi:hypothetical protein
MILIILGTLLALVVATLFVLRSSIKPPKDGVVRVQWKDRSSLPSLSSRVPLVLVGALFKKEGKFYPGFKDFPETHIEIGASECVAHRSPLRTPVFPAKILANRTEYLWI